MEEDKRKYLIKSLQEDSVLLNKVQNILFHEENSRMSEILENDETFHKFRNASLLDESVLEDETLLPLTNVCLTYSKFTDLRKLLQKEAAAKESVGKKIGKYAVEKIEALVKEFEGKDFIDDDIINNVLLYHQVRNVAVKCVVQRLGDMYSKPKMKPILNLKTDHIDYNDAVENLKYLVTVSWKERLARAEDLSFNMDFLKTILEYWRKSEVKKSNNETNRKHTNSSIAIDLKNKKETIQFEQVNSDNDKDVKSDLNIEKLTTNVVPIQIEHNSQSAKLDSNDDVTKKYLNEEITNKINYGVMEKIATKTEIQINPDKIAMTKKDTIELEYDSENKSNNAFPREKDSLQNSLENLNEKLEKAKSAKEKDLVQNKLDTNLKDLDEICDPDLVSEKLDTNRAVDTFDVLHTQITSNEANALEDETGIILSNYKESNLDCVVVPTEDVPHSNNNDKVIKPFDETNSQNNEPVIYKSKVQHDMEDEDPDYPDAIDDNALNTNKYVEKASHGKTNNNTDDDPDDPDAIDNGLSENKYAGKSNQSTKGTTGKAVCATRTVNKTINASSSSVKICCSLCSDKNSSNLDELLRHYSLKHFRDSIEKHYLPSWKGTCDLCQKPMSSKPELVTHIGVEHDTVMLEISTTKGGYQCPICKKEFLNDSYYKQHLVGTHFNNQIANDYLISESKFKCKFCAKECENKRSIILHIGIDHNKIEIYLSAYKKADSGASKQIKCKYCDVTTNFSIMKVHYMEDHFFEDLVNKCKKENLLSEDNTCQYCKHTTKSENELTKHLGIRHNKILKFIDSVPVKFVKANFRKVDNIEEKGREENMNDSPTNTPKIIPNARPLTGPLNNFTNNETSDSSAILPKSVTKKDTSVYMANKGKSAAPLKPKFIKMASECQPDSASKSLQPRLNSVLPKALNSNTLIALKQKASNSSENQPTKFTSNSCKVCRANVPLKDIKKHFFLVHYRKLALSRLQKLHPSADQTGPSEVQPSSDKSTPKCPNQTCLKELQDESTLIDHFVTQHTNSNQTLLETQKEETEKKKLTNNNKHDKTRPITHASKATEHSNTSTHMKSGKQISTASTGNKNRFKDQDKFILQALAMKIDSKTKTKNKENFISKNKENLDETLTLSSDSNEMLDSQSISSSISASEFMPSPMPASQTPTSKQKPSPMTISKPISSTMLASKSTPTSPMLATKSAPTSKQKPSLMTISKPISSPMVATKSAHTSIQKPSPMTISKLISSPMLASKSIPTSKQKPSPMLASKPMSNSSMLTPKPEPKLSPDEFQQLVCQPCKFIATQRKELVVHRQALGHKFKVIKSYSKSGNELNRTCLFCKKECPQQNIFNHLEAAHWTLYMVTHFKLSKGGSKEDSSIDTESVNNKEKTQLKVEVVQEPNNIEVETERVNSYWFLTFKDFCVTRKELSGAQTFQKSHFKMCNSSMLDHFFEKVLVQDRNFSKFDEIIKELGKSGLNFEDGNIEDLQIVKRYTLFKEYDVICDNLGTSIERCDIMHIIIFLSQLLARVDVSKEDVQWTLLAISNVHEDVNDLPLEKNKKITDFFAAIGITLGGETTNSRKELAAPAIVGNNEKTKCEKLSKVVNLDMGSSTITSLKTSISNNKIEVNEPRNVTIKSHDIVNASQLKRKRKFLDGSERKNNEPSPKTARKVDNIPVEAKNINNKEHSLSIIASMKDTNNSEGQIEKYKSNSKGMSINELKSVEAPLQQESEKKKSDCVLEASLIKTSVDTSKDTAEETDKLTKNTDANDETDRIAENNDVNNETGKLTENSDTNEEIYKYYCLECEGCSEDRSCDHKSHSRHLIGIDIAEHFMKTGHLNCQLIGKFMKLGALEDLAYSTQWGNTIRKRWKQMVVTGTMEVSKYPEPRACKRKACSQIMGDSFTTFKHIRSSHL